MLNRIAILTMRLAEAEAVVDRIRAERDEAIADARDEGVPIVRIAEAAKLTRRAVYDSLERSSR